MHSIIYGKLMKAKKEKDLELMKTLYENNSNNLQISLEYAKLLAKKNKIDESRELFLYLLNTQIDTCAMLELGKLEKELGNIDLARSYFRKLIKNPYDKNYALLELGILEKEQGNYKLARKYFNELIKCSTDKTYAFLELGRLEKEVGNVKLARSYFKELLNKQNRSHALVELGILEYELGNKNLARTYFKELVNNPNDIVYGLPLLILLEISEQNYDLAFHYIKLGLKESVTISSSLLLYISKKLNVFFDIDYSKIRTGYTLEQILNYDEYVSLGHVLDRHSNEEKEILDFNKNIDVYKLFNDVKNNLNQENKINSLVFNDHYLIRMDNIGSKGENYLFVVTLPNSQDIITMYPVKSKNSINRYLKEYEDTNEKVLIKK